MNENKLTDRLAQESLRDLCSRHQFLISQLSLRETNAVFAWQNKICVLAIKHAENLARENRLVGKANIK